MNGRWQKLSPSERLRAQAIVASLLLGIYAPFFFVSKGKLAESEKKIHRRADRIKKRAATPDSLAGGPAPQAIVKQIQEVDAKLTGIRASFDELDTGFAPVESIEMRQQLMLEISTLAERTGVEILSVARKGFSPEKELGLPVVDPLLGRPLLEVTANADFRRLLEFLHGLRDLSFYVAVMNLKVHSRHLQQERRPASGYLSPGAISVSFELSI